jgi:prepilin-type N-terminal cleavage/methylation domain-containing protein/prepilin-type processing-associated H-X9-DG protein
MEKQKGFTLIELLVVIAIIALLMSILMPALAKVRVQARTVVCKADLKQWSLVFSMYTGANNSNFWIGGSGWGDEWLRANLSSFLEKGGIACCPEAVKPRLTGAQKIYSALIFPEGYQFHISGDILKSDLALSFGLNSWIENVQLPNIWSDQAKYFKTVNVAGAGNIPMLADSTAISNWPDTASITPPYEGASRTEPGPSGQMWDFCFSRHGGGITNVLFMDGSARTGGLKKLWRLKWNTTFDTKVTPNWASEGDWILKRGAADRDFN